MVLCWTALSLYPREWLNIDHSVAYVAPKNNNSTV
jgi:hypothetical protein